MGIRLFFFVPLIERGGNGRPSFSYDNFYLLEIDDPRHSLPWRHWVDTNTAKEKKKVTLTVIGVKALTEMARDLSDSRVRLYTPELVQLTLSTDNNSGKDGENVLPIVYPEFIKTNNELDNNGIDFILEGTPVQLKTFSHGITANMKRLETGKKRNGISCSNLTFQELVTWDYYQF